MNKATNYLLISLIFAAALSYVCFANAAVRTLTSLEKTKSQIQSLSVKVSDMESKRLSLENGMNTKVALQMGFVQVDHPTFIVKSLKKASLSLKTD